MPGTSNEPAAWSFLRTSCSGRAVKRQQAHSWIDSLHDMSSWNEQIIAEFRASGGKAAQFGDAPLVILHTIGAKSGQVREIPLVALVESDTMYVFASKAGATTNPDWYFNLKANPAITVEFGTETFTAQVAELSPADAAAKLDAQAQVMPQFGEYVKSAAPRVIPAFSITRT
jgi:deazaflavin-dependent oxidoreductase (nitroreductase family)